MWRHIDILHIWLQQWYAHEAQIHHTLALTPRELRRQKTVSFCCHQVSHLTREKSKPSINWTPSLSECQHKLPYLHPTRRQHSTLTSAPEKGTEPQPPAPDWAPPHRLARGPGGGRGGRQEPPRCCCRPTPDQRRQAACRTPPCSSAAAAACRRKAPHAHCPGRRVARWLCLMVRFGGWRRAVAGEWLQWCGQQCRRRRSVPWWSAATVAERHALSEAGPALPRTKCKRCPQEEGQTLHTGRWPHLRSDFHNTAAICGLTTM